METSTIRHLRESGIIAIGRDVPGEALLRTVEALYQGGIRLLELTYNQSDPRALELLPRSVGLLVERFPEMDIGAGTVLTREQVEAAAQAGARFIVSPNTDPAVIRRTKELGLMSVPGAMTPSEVVAAHLGGYQAWMDAPLLANHLRVWFDTSSALWAMTPGYASELIHRLGTDRVMFGTDYPVKVYETELTRFFALDLTEAERTVILYDNAARFLGLGSAN